MFDVLLQALVDLLTVLLNPYTLIFAGVAAIVFLVNNREYQKTTYYKITKTPMLAVLRDLGKYGEYQIYKRLRKFEKSLGVKFLFNVYIPKENGETTEIDALMISSKGVLVFESKNYSGWIFGNESQYYWTQVLPKGRGRSNKEKFYNPIMQNEGHIKHLKLLVGENIPMYSIITFSERCTLKEVTVVSGNVEVINRDAVKLVVSALFNHYPEVLSTKEMDNIYNVLYPFTQVDDDTKQQHILNIKGKTKIKNTTDNPKPIGEIEETTLEEVCHQENEVSDLRCPKCNGELVMRTARHGENKGKSFYGCSNYPKCKYIQEHIQ